jgi:3-dehydroquinate synthetase
MAGLEMEFSLAESKLGLDPLWRNKVSAFRKEHYPVLPDFNSVDLMKYLQQDKKNRDGNILVCLLSEPGSAKYDVAVTETDLLKLFEEYGIK